MNNITMFAGNGFDFTDMDVVQYINVALYYWHTHGMWDGYSDKFALTALRPNGHSSSRLKPMKTNEGYYANISMTVLSTAVFNRILHPGNFEIDRYGKFSAKYNGVETAPVELNGISLNWK